MIPGGNEQRKECLFLETSAQICRLSGVLELEDRVTKKIKDYSLNYSESNWGCRLITSTVVYAEFLSTRITDILLVRDLVKEEFLDKNKFELSLHEIHESLTKYSKIRGNRAQRTFSVTAELNKRFNGVKKIETRRIMRFLDTIARDIAFKDFFLIRIGEMKIQIEYESPCYLKDIGCLTWDPLQEDCAIKNTCECRHKIDAPNGHNNSHTDKCLVTDSPTTKCRENPKEFCNVEKFFSRSDIKKNIELLETAAKGGKFSPAFRYKSKNKKWLDLLKETDFTRERFKHRGQNCWRYFFDMLILLQCPDDAVILSNDPDFGELGKAIGRDDFWISF